MQPKTIKLMAIRNLRCNLFFIRMEKANTGIAVNSKDGFSNKSFASIVIQSVQYFNRLKCFTAFLRL
ncbi:MAG: hypothetical protein M3367_10930 [Acidobacteriota bacterium]|nr:hypothetical protein [Acidobacteriota bacterium]